MTLELLVAAGGLVVDFPQNFPGSTCVKHGTSPEFDSLRLL